MRCLSTELNGVRDRCNDESTDQPKHPERSLSRAISRDTVLSRDTQDKSSRDKFPRQAPAGTGSEMLRDAYTRVQAE